MVAFALLMLVQGQDFPTPPFVRERTYRVEWMGAPVMDGDVAYFQAVDTVRAFDVRLWKQLWLWKSKGKDSPDELTLTGDRVYIATSSFDEPKAARLVAIDKKTGAESWSLPRSGPASTITVDQGTLYTAMESETLSAIDIRTRTKLWTADMRGPTSEGEGRASAETLSQVAGGHIFVATFDQRTLGVNTKTGKVDWSVDNSYSFGGTPIVKDGVVIYAAEDALEGRDAATGRLLWSSERTIPWFAASLGPNVVMLEDDVIAIQPKTGRIAWRIPLSSGDRIGGWNQGGFVKGEVAFLDTDHGGLMINMDGNVLWRLPQQPSFALPIWMEGEKIVAYEFRKLMAYRQGAHAPLPTDPVERSKLATDLVAQFELLDGSEVARLTELGDDAFEPVLREYLKWTQAYEDMPETDENFAVRDPLSDVAYDLADILKSIFTPKRTALVIHHVNPLPIGHTARNALMELVSRKGEGAASIEFMLQSLRSVDIESKDIPEEAWTAVYAVAKSSEPAAVDFMLAALKNDKAEPRIRDLAFRNLARTGGERGLAAVLAARSPRRLLPPLIERMELEELNNPDKRWPRTELYEKRTDSSGRTWGLIRNGALANGKDLWIVEEVGGRWVRPYLTGAHLPGETSFGASDENKKFYGKTAKELVEGAWFEVFVGNPEILLDSDEDGLTDLMETRLGTDHMKADTDGDGDNDLVDPWPDTVPREMNDTESVLAAVFGARYMFEGHAEPAIFSSEDVAVPFEMSGRLGPVLWRRNDDNSRRLHPLMSCYENGVAMIGFHEPRDFEDESPPTGNTVLWNADRTEATVTISTYWGGLAGDGTFARVRKFGDNWVVVEMELRYVS